jgi:heptosyltransferase-1
MAMPRLLIVKTSSLGDVIHNLPVIADLHAHVPELMVDWVVEENFADIPALHPGVAEVIPVAVRRWRKRLFSRATQDEIAAFRKKLSGHHYDWVLDTQGLLKSAVISAGAKGVRHGQDWNSAREPLASLFYRHRHAVARGQHAVARNRQLAAQALSYMLDDAPPDYGIPRATNRYPGLPRQYVVGLHGTSRDSKLWPIEQWIALGKILAGQDLPLILPWGNEAERLRAEQVAAAVPNAVVLPRLRLADLATVLSGAKAAVGVDTGLIHLAVALDVPTVAIYTDTDPALTGVLGGRDARTINLGGVGQNPSPDQVLAALTQVLSTPV